MDVYQVSHYGAENGTTAELLEALTPQIAVISVGRADSGADDQRNAFRHWNVRSPNLFHRGGSPLLTPMNEKVAISGVFAVHSLVRS